jgi:hypothetical protein
MKFGRLGIWLLVLMIWSCGGDNGPNAPTEDSPNANAPDSIISDISALDLDVTLSSESILQTESLTIHMRLLNPTEYPANITFGTSCQEFLWVYDPRGDYLGDPYTCLMTPSALALDPGEYRDYSFEWSPCPNLPGLYTIIAGFRDDSGDMGYTCDPITVELITSNESMAGTWHGFCRSISGVPDWQSADFTMSLTQDGTRIHGSVVASGDPIEYLSGTIENNELEIRIGIYEYDRAVTLEGNICNGYVSGRMRIRYTDTNRDFLQFWEATKVD